MSILRVKHGDNSEAFLETDLPQGLNNEQLLEATKSAVKLIEPELYGKKVFINGRITVVMALYLGHALAHICKDVNMFDPKENTYVRVIAH